MAEDNILQLLLFRKKFCVSEKNSYEQLLTSFKEHFEIFSKQKPSNHYLWENQSKKDDNTLIPIPNLYKSFPSNQDLNFKSKRTRRTFIPMKTVLNGEKYQPIYLVSKKIFNSSCWVHLSYENDDNWFCRTGWTEEEWMELKPFSKKEYYLKNGINGEMTTIHVPTTPIHCFRTKIADEWENKETVPIQYVERQFLITRKQFQDKIKMTIWSFTSSEQFLNLLQNQSFAPMLQTTTDKPIEFVQLKDNGKINFVVLDVNSVLSARIYFEQLGFIVQDRLYKLQGIQIFYTPPEEFEQRALNYIEEKRKQNISISDQQLVQNIPFPLRSYVMYLLFEKGSSYVKQLYHIYQKKKLYDRGPVLSEEQTIQLLDAYYWTFLAPEDQRIDFSIILSFYEMYGRKIRLKEPHTRTGESIGRTSTTGKLRQFSQNKVSKYFGLSKYIQKNEDGSVVAKKAHPRKIAPKKRFINPFFHLAKKPKKNVIHMNILDFTVKKKQKIY